MNWFDSFVNALGLGVLAATAATQLFEYWRRQDAAQQEQAQRQHQGAEAPAGISSESEDVASISPYMPFPAPGREGMLLEAADLQRLAQHLDVLDLLALFMHPRLALGLSERDFTEADYEALSRLDDDVCTRQPVSDAQIAALPTHVHRVPCAAGQGGRAPEEAGGLGTCSVCLDDFGDGAVRGRAAPCPVCKTPVFQA
ncbi:hypothetical protein WJX81_004412 [Elliptochloris bilobata]|uniref:Uncharacterized protein n=1 Tax=Elliptochloris bilobata TaxID=381761 RepID=A0AAW1RCW6_9CHLO